jgi:hypothetical protein
VAADEARCRGGADHRSGAERRSADAGSLEQAASADAFLRYSHTHYLLIRNDLVY